MKETPQGELARKCEVYNNMFSGLSVKCVINNHFMYQSNSHLKKYFQVSKTYHRACAKEEAKASTATVPTAGNNTLVLPNLSDSLPIKKAPGIQPTNRIDCARLAYASLPQMRFH